MGKHDLALKRQGLAIEGHRIDLVRQNIGQKRVAAIRHRRRCLCAENQLHAPRRPRIACREGPQRLEVGAVRCHTSRVIPVAKHLLQYSDHLGGAVVAEEVIGVGGVLRLGVPLEVFGHRLDVLWSQIEHLLMQGPPLPQVQVLKPPEALDAKPVIHASFHKTHVKSFVDHKGAVVENVVEADFSIKHPNGRVPKGRVQICSWTCRQHGHPGRLRKLVGQTACHRWIAPHGQERQGPRPCATEHPPRRTEQPDVLKCAPGLARGLNLQPPPTRDHVTDMAAGGRVFAHHVRQCCGHHACATAQGFRLHAALKRANVQAFAFFGHHTHVASARAVIGVVACRQGRLGQIQAVEG